MTKGEQAGCVDGRTAGSGELRFRRWRRRRQRRRPLHDGHALHPFDWTGASGYVLKRSASDRLVRAIKEVAGGQAYLQY